MRPRMSPLDDQPTPGRPQPGRRPRRSSVIFRHRPSVGKGQFCGLRHVRQAFLAKLLLLYGCSMGGSLSTSSSFVRFLIEVFWERADGRGGGRNFSLFTLTDGGGGVADGS